MIHWDVALLRYPLFLYLLSGYQNNIDREKNEILDLMITRYGLPREELEGSLEMQISKFRNFQFNSAGSSNKEIFNHSHEAIWERYFQGGANSENMVIDQLYTEIFE